MTQASLLIAVAAAVALLGLWRALRARSDPGSGPALYAMPGADRVDVELGEIVRETLGRDVDGAAPVHVVACPAQIRTLLEQLRALAQDTALQWLLRVDGPHAVLHLLDSGVGENHVRLTAFFDGRWPARGALQDRIALCRQIVKQHSGRIYAAPSPLGGLALTVRLPLHLPHPVETSFVAL